LTDAVTIAFFNPMYRAWPDTPETCATPAVFTHDRDALATADAVVFHLPTLDQRAFRALRKPRRQLWVGWSMESPVMHPDTQAKWVRQRIDLWMTYERTSDVWCPYLFPSVVGEMFQAPPPTTQPAPVVWLQSNANDRSGRKQYAAELARRVWIDSYGSVGRTREERIPRGRKHELALYAQYKFALAFENSYAPDYVTEKFWHPLAAGSVPVYRGTADVADLAPAPRCYIDTRDVASATELGAYLDHLDRHDDEYAAFHAWRREPIRPSFATLLARAEGSHWCRLAAAVAATRSPTRHGFGRRRR